jgi:hypothetical protein
MIPKMRTLDAVKKSTHLLFVLGDERDVPAIAIQTTVGRYQSHCVRDCGRPLDPALICSGPVGHAAMRRGSARDASVSGRGQTFAPSFSDASIYA